MSAIVDHTHEVTDRTTSGIVVTKTIEAMINEGWELIHIQAISRYGETEETLLIFRRKINEADIYRNWRR